MPSLTDIYSDPAYINANDATRAAIFNLWAPQDPLYRDANSATQEAIRKKWLDVDASQALSDQKATERTWGEAAKDVGAGLVTGIGNVVQVPGQLYGLATGDFSETGALGVGKAIEKYGEEMKSAGLKAREAQRAAKVKEAEKTGQWEAFKTALGETITDPALFSSFITEQAPQLIPMFIGGAGAASLAARGAAKAAVARGASEAAIKKIAEKKALQAGVETALQTGAVMQGADVGSGTYDAIYKYLTEEEKLSEEEAAAKTINLARAAGASGYVLSLLGNKYMPGGRAIEEILAGKKLTGSRLGAAVATGLKEIPGENIEEIGGRFTQNLAMRDVKPDQSLTEGLGETGALATLGAAGLGGITGFAGHRAPRAPEQRPPAVTPAAPPTVPPATPPVQAGEFIPGIATEEEFATLEPPQPPGVPSVPQTPQTQQTEAQRQEAPAAPGNQPRIGDAFNPAGWTEQEKKINAKTGKPTLGEGRTRYTRVDENGFTQNITVQDGEVKTSNAKSPLIELTNSIFDFEAPVRGNVHVNNSDVQGLTLTFVPDASSDAVATKMSPRAVQQYKDGVPIEKIAETEFSDAGGIEPDGTRTPHTTVGKLAGTEVKQAKAQRQEAPAAPIEQTEAAKALPETPTVPPVKIEKPIAEPITESIVSGIQTTEVPVASLTLSKDVPQFKIGASKEGIVEPLGGKFERVGVAPIQVWQRNNGDLEIISGRHRFDLAKRSGEKTIPAQIHYESQGFDATKAAALDAELNIRDGQGKVKDYVNYFKATNLDKNTAESGGLLARATGKRSYTIANEGSDELIAAVRGDQIGDEAAYYIALNAPNDPKLQSVGIKAVMDGKSGNAAVNLMQAIKALGVENDTTTDMFGFDEGAMKEAAAMANIAARKQRELQTRLSAISGAAKNPKLAAEEGIDVKDPQAVERRIAEIKQQKAAWDNWSTSPELIAQIRAERGVAAPTLELRGETEAEIRRREAAQEEERRAAEEKAIADRERDFFGLQPQTQEKEAPPTEDMFGARGLMEQPGQKQPEAPPIKEGLFAEEEKAAPKIGQVVQRIPMPDNMEARVFKTKDGYGASLYDKGSGNVLNESGISSVVRYKGANALEMATAKAQEYAGKAKLPEETADIKLARKELEESGKRPGQVLKGAKLMRRNKLIEYERELEEAKRRQKINAENVVNNDEPDADLPANKRLILMPCSSTKGDVTTKAIDLYKGVFYQSFKTNVKSGGEPHVVILSAKHGFISPDEEIAPYDQVMTPERAAEFKANLKAEINKVSWPKNIEDVLIVGGKDYQDVMRAALAELINEGKISEFASINATSGGIGEQRQQLNKYLDSIPVKEPVTEKAKEPSGALTLMKDGIEGREIPFEQVPNGNDAFQYAVGKTESDGPEAVFRRRADQRGTYGGWRVETDVNKLKAAEEPGVGVDEKEAAETKAPSFYKELLPSLGFERLPADSDRSYSDKGGTKYVTFERDGVRLAFKSNLLLFKDDKGRKMFGYAEPNESVFGLLETNDSKRGQGLAKKAMQDVVDAADKSKTTLYLEPISLDISKGMSTEALAKFYKRYGFEQVEKGDDSILVREPKEVSKEKPATTKEQIEYEKINNTWDEIKYSTDDYVAYYGGKQLFINFKNPKISNNFSINEFVVNDRGALFIGRLPTSKVGEPLRIYFTDNLNVLNADDLIRNKTLKLSVTDRTHEAKFREAIGDKAVDAFLDSEPKDVLRKTSTALLGKNYLPVIDKLSQAWKEREEQIKNAKAHAKDLGGEVVWQEGDYALIRGYSLFTGDPVYAGTKGTQRSIVDIESFSGELIPADIRAKMIGEKVRLEAEAEKLHREEPFIVFDRNLALSKDVSPELGGVVREWKDLLKLDVPIYVSTIQDAKANRDNFTGPHRRIGSGTLDEKERGSMRRMSDGSYYILFDKSTSPTRMLEVIAHEMGHLHQRLVYEKASPVEKDALQQAHKKWLDEQKGKTAQELVNALRGRSVARTAKAPEGMSAEQMDSYWKSFGEWYADQTSRWAMSAKAPVTIVERFFKRLGNQLRLFYQRLKNAKYLPDETFKDYIEKATQRPTNLKPGADQIDAAERNQISFNFDDDKKATDEIAKADPAMTKTLHEIDQLPNAKKRLPPGRSPELAAAANMVADGTMTAAEYDKLVNRYKPIPVFSEPLAPASEQAMYEALKSNQRDLINPQIPSGKEVGIRIDLPAAEKGVLVVAIHEKRTSARSGNIIGYASSAVIKNVTFGIGSQKTSLRIAAGEKKDSLHTMEGQYVPSSPSETYAKAKEAMGSGTWIQVGFDPTRHAYFYDRQTTLPVIKANDVIQIGNMVLARGVTYGAKESFLYNIDQGDLFGGREVSPPVVKRGRSPELTEAAERLRRGEITKAEYDAAVEKFSPVRLYTEPPVPPTDSQVKNALDSNKQQYANREIPTGKRVGLRLDIPAQERRNTWVVAIHEPKPTITSPKAPAIISYRSVAALRNVTFGLGDQARSLRIAAGEFKDKLQTMEGEYVNLDPQNAYQLAKDLINDPNYVQIGFNPTRHAYFYDRSTMQPVVKAGQVLQIGNFIIAKDVTYGRREDFLYDIGEGSTRTTMEEMRDIEIKQLSAAKRRLNRLITKVGKGEVSIDLQRQVTELSDLSKSLKISIDATRPRKDTPADFLARASKAFADGDISQDVFAVIQAAYQKEPDLLKGLLLSVKAGKGEGAAGQFMHLSRIVRLYKGTKGIEDPQTFRHELNHALEQMMLPEQRKLVVDQYFKDLSKAIERNTDKRHQEYFQAVMDFLDNPNNRNYEKAAAKLPSYEMYQFINPSEYWAVNAESLMARQLGSSWERFKMAVRRLFEGLKNVFGFDNQYAIHKVFHDIMNGDKKRISHDILVDYINSTGQEFTAINNIKQDEDLIKKYNRPHTPMLNTKPLATFVNKQWSNGKQLLKDFINNPKEALTDAGEGVTRGVLYLRNKNAWYGSALESADFARYSGALRTSEGLVTASVALDNAIHSGNIGIEVLFRGGLEYVKNLGRFVAVKRNKGMKGVYEAEKKLKDRLGDQLGTDIIQGYLEAKRSISIINELNDREADLELAKQNLEALRAAQKPDDEISLAVGLVNDLKKDLDAIKRAASSVHMGAEEMQEFAALDQRHPELRDIMDNWTALNQNLLKVWRQVGLLSEGRYQTLSNIKDYVPWNRIMDDEEDIHSPLQSTTRTLTNIGKEKLFRRGKPLNVTDFRAEAGQQSFNIQPSSVVKVEVNGQEVPSSQVSVTPDGNVAIGIPINEGDVVVFTTNREIENIIDNMTRNAMRMTMNALRQNAANRIVREYASRNENNKIMVFRSVDPSKGRFNYISNGKRIVVEISDPLIAESIYGMEKINLDMLKPLALAANFVRRTITLSGTFQIKQVFKDAPQAALITGVKNPFALIGGVWKGFVTSLTNTDPVVDILRASGIGGFHSPARTPEAEIKRRIGVMNKSVYHFLIKGLDHIGDSSDMAQRVAVYKRVMAETGDETQAIYQAANVINFLHHGSGGTAQAIVKTVPFMGAYLNSMDVLINALMGGGLKGMERKKALQRLAITGSLLAMTTLLYCMVAGGDPDYDELDDQTKLKNYIIPGTKIVLPANTSAAYFYKAVPELIYDSIIKKGTDNEYDARRLRKALAETARDLLLGPEPVPAGVKPLVEVALNHDFFTGRSVIPESVKDLDAAEQYVGSTSELAKKLSAITSYGDDKRAISPVQAQHIIRGLFGTTGAMASWFSNEIGAISGVRPELELKEYPFVGPLVRPEAPRGKEDLYYDLREVVTQKYQTWKSMVDRGDDDAADAYMDKYENLIALHKYMDKLGHKLGKINAQIRNAETSRDKDYTPQERRQDIRDYKQDKIDFLEDIKDLRREALAK